LNSLDPNDEDRIVFRFLNNNKGVKRSGFNQITTSLGGTLDYYSAIDWFVFSPSSAFSNNPNTALDI